MRSISLVLIAMSLSAVCQGYRPADFDRDGIVNFYDFAVFSDQWLDEDPNVTAGSFIYTVAASDAPNSLKVKADYICDGIDDQVEIQSAIDALPDGGGKILLLGGQYNVDKAGDHYCINLRNNTTLEGLGWGTVIYLVDDANATVVYAREVKGAVVRDLAIDGNKNNQFPVTNYEPDMWPDMWTNGICLDYSSSCLISNVYVKDTLMHGINLNDHSCSNIVENCFVEDIGTDWTVYQAASCILIFNHCDDNVVKNNVCVAASINPPTASRGIYVSYYSSRNLIDGNILTDFRQGIWFVFSYCNANEFINNCIYDCDLCGIGGTTNSHITSSCNIIAANRIENCVGDGISFCGQGTTEGYKWIITDNIVNGATRAFAIYTGKLKMNDIIVSGNQLVCDSNGIFITSCNNIQITDNLIDSDGFGVCIGAGNSGVILRGNNIKSILAGISGDIGAISEIAGNVGFITENSGIATIAAEDNSIVVAHGLDLTPTDGDIIVVPTNSMGNATKFYVSNYTSTNFKITVDQAPGPATATFAWKAKIEK